MLAGAINRATKESLSRVRSAPLLTNEQDAATYTLPDFSGDVDALDVLVRCASLAFRRSRSERLLRLPLRPRRALKICFCA